MNPLMLLRRNRRPRYSTADWDTWNQAHTLQALGDLTARWLEGTMPYQPLYGGGPAHETRELVPHLAAYNRAGYVTTNSQPAIPAHDGWAQRAWVHGFGTAETADRIEAALLDTDLLVCTTPPGGANPTRICVTIHDDRAWTIGGAISAHDVAEQYGAEVPAALPALLAAWQIEVIDPQWGRNDLLWARLGQALKARNLRPAVAS